MTILNSKKTQNKQKKMWKTFYFLCIFT